MFFRRIRRQSTPRTAVMALPLLALGLLAPVAAAAQPITAYTTTNVNQRAGPATKFPVIVTVPATTRIVVQGYLQAVDWCDVEYDRSRGWMSADYIQAYSQGAYHPIRQVARSLGVAVVAFDIDAYWRAYYQSRPFYAELPRWRTPAPRPPATNVGVFYNRLSPHGDWVWVQGQYVWVPANVDSRWRPYTVGRWAYTSRYGWMWVSDEPFGWATYHYGRWAYSNRIGWFWVPDTRWGPAWVTWRGSDDYLAWAPLPPSAYEGGYFSVSTRPVPDYYWQVVPAQSFLTINISTVIVRDRDRADTALQAAQPLGAVKVTDGRVMNGAVPVPFVERTTEEAVVVHEVVATDQPAEAGTSEGDAIEVFVPPAEPAEAVPAAPPEVTPIEVVEQASETKDQAGNEPTTEALVEAPPEPAAVEPATADTAPPSAETPAEPPAPAAQTEEPQPAPAEEPPPPAPAAEEPPPPPAQVEELPPPPPAPAQEQQPAPAAEEPPPPPPAQEAQPAPAAEEPPPPPAQAVEPPPPPAPEPAPPPPPPPPAPEPEAAPPPPPEPAVEVEPPPPPPPPVCPEGTELQSDGSCA
jgi:uncharacterized protein YraI